MVFYIQINVNNAGEKYVKVFINADICCSFIKMKNLDVCINQFILIHTHTHT